MFLVAIFIFASGPGTPIDDITTYRDGTSLKYPAVHHVVAAASIRGAKVAGSSQWAPAGSKRKGPDESDAGDNNDDGRGSKKAKTSDAPAATPAATVAMDTE